MSEGGIMDMNTIFYMKWMLANHSLNWLLFELLGFRNLGSVT